MHIYSNLLINNLSHLTSSLHLNLIVLLYLCPFSKDEIERG